MTYNEFKKRITTLHEYSNKICKASEVLETELFEGLLGQLFDLLYSAYLDDLSEDDNFYDALGRILYQNELDEDELLDIYRTWIGGLDD